MRRAADLVYDLGLSHAKSILERTHTRGEIVLGRFGCAAVTLSVFYRQTSQHPRPVKIPKLSEP